MSTFNIQKITLMKNSTKTICSLVLGLASLSSLVSTQNAAAGDFRLPAFETTKLKNGMTVYMMERHDVPLISVKAVLKAGAIYDGQGFGLSNITGDALLLGSKQYDKKTLDQAFDFRGARISSTTGLDSTAVTADLAAKDLNDLLPMFASVLTQPSFEPSELDKLLARTVDGLKQEKESPGSVIQNYYRSMLFGKGAYANPVSGSVHSVSALKKTDLEAFHQAYYRPENTALIVVGDFKASSMREQLQNLFGAWQAGTSAAAAINTGEVKADKARVWLVNKSDANETTFVFGGAGIARNDPDYVALQVINTILGGRFTSWLNDELRINSGLTYGANSAFLPLSKTGTFLVSSFTALPKTEAALALATKTYQRLWDKGIDAKTLESAKAYVKGQYPPRFETNQQLAGLLGEMFISNVGREQIDHFMRDVDSLTPEKTKALINKHFPRDKLQMVLIGKAENLREIAAKYGEVTELDITANGFTAGTK